MGMIVLLVALFLASIFLKWWIVGCAAVAIALMFGRFREMAVLIPLTFIAVLILGVACRLGYQAVRHWDDPSVKDFLHKYVID